MEWVEQIIHLLIVFMGFAACLFLGFIIGKRFGSFGKFFDIYLRAINWKLIRFNKSTHND